MNAQAVRRPSNATACGRHPDVLVYDSFDEIGIDCWQDLWRRADAPSVFARYEWLAGWWRTCAGERHVRLYVARDRERVLAILPTAWPKASRVSREPVVLVGHNHADYAAVLVDRERPDALGSLLAVVAEDLPNHGTFRMADLRSDSSLAPMLAELARPWWSKWRPEDKVPCPRASFRGSRLDELTRKESLRRHSNKLNRLGTVAVNHFQSTTEILPRLDAFFAQHVERWSGTDSPSLFLYDHNRELYREWARSVAPTGDLIYTEITLDGAPVACHFGFISEGDLVWYKPCFALALAKVSPGEVLIKELLLLAGARGLAGMDFTRGAEAFKQRFADQQRLAMTFVLHGRHTTCIRLRAERWLRHQMRRLLRRS